jgi:hypothetical protein
MECEAASGFSHTQFKTRKARMNRKKWILALSSVIGLGFGYVAAVADDVSSGYTQVSETPEKGERSRTKTLNVDKELVERKVVNEDGSVEVHSFKNGVRTAKTVTDKDGARTGEFEYYPDGKLKRELKAGVLAFERRKLADGTFEAIRYKKDGKSAQMRRRVSVDGGFELTHFRTDSNKIYFTANIKGVSGQFEWCYYAPDGSQLRRVVGETQMVVTVYGETGDIKLEQVWLKTKGKFVCKSVNVKEKHGYRRYTNDDSGKLSFAEDLDADGTVVTTWKANQVNPPADALFAEQFEDDDPTIPEDE